MPVERSGGGGGGGTQGTEIGYDQITASVTITSTTEAAGTTVIAAAAHTFDGAPVIATFYSSVVTVQGNAAGDFVAVSLFEGVTQIGEFGTTETPAAGAGSMQQSMTAMVRFTPTAGAHTYTVTAFKNRAGAACSVLAGSGGAGGVLPCFLRFTKV